MSFLDRFKGVVSGGNNALNGAVDTLGGLSDSAAGIGDTIGQFEETGIALGLIDAEQNTPKIVTIKDPANTANAVEAKVTKEFNAKIPLFIVAGLALLFGGKKLLG